MFDIKSLANEKVKSWSKLKNTKEIKSSGFFIVESENNINEAIKKGVVHTLLVRKPLGIHKSEIIVTKDILSKISDTVTPQKMIAICKLPSNEDVLAKKVIYLDDIQDPGNVGTIIRTAVAFGIEKVILSKGSAFPYSPKVVRSTQSALWNIIVEINDFEDIKEEKNNVIATAITDNATLLNDLEEQEEYIIVFGNESQGIKEEIIEQAKHVVFIPMSGVESLNVSVASGIVLNKIEGGK